MKFFIGFALTIGLVIVVFILIWRGFSGGGGGEQPAPLMDYAFTPVAMQLTIDGEISAEQEHNAVRITVSRSESRIEVLESYQYNVVSSRSYASNQEAYVNFLRALDLLGYTKGNDDPELADERGYCPTGRRYIYRIVDGTDVIQKYWSTSCGGQGTFEGQRADVRDLFREQIPDYGSITRDVDL